MDVSWSVELFLQSLKFSAKVGELNEVPLHLHPSENFRHILNLLKSSSYLHYYSLWFWAGHETLLEAGVGVYDVGELPIKQGVESLSCVFVQPDTLQSNTVVSITPHLYDLSLPD